jgi:ribosomal protein L2
MNPVDHPHGGRSNGGIPSVTPWGLPTKCGFYLRKKKIINYEQICMKTKVYWFLPVKFSI